MTYRALTTVLLAGVCVFLTTAFALAQPPAPPPPAKYQIVLRYRIAAARDAHVVQYDALVEYLKKLPFQFEPPLENNPRTDREDPFKNYLRGTIASDALLKILGNANVATILAMPEGFEYPPTELDKSVRVRLELAGGLSSDGQRELASQVKAILLSLNFREAVGYDHHGYGGRPFTRLLGTIPRGRLEVLLKDLRGQPAGWFAPRIPPQNLPSPLRTVNPIQIVEVLDEPEPIAEIALPPSRMPEYLEKISPALWELVEDKGQNDQPIRIELLFAGTLSEQVQAWRRKLEETSPGIFVEAQLGHMVNVVVRRGQVKALAALDRVSTIRLPQAARVDIDPNTVLPGDNNKALFLSGLDAWHKKGYLGQGVRLAILDTDFSGWDLLVKERKLPAATRLIDLTASYDPELYPASSNEQGRLGHGTQCALAAALAAPQARLVLVRLEASSPYQVDEVLRYMRGSTLSSPYIDRRRDELVTARAELNHLVAQVQRERRIILDNYVDEADLDSNFGFLGPVYGWVFSPRTWSRAQVAYVAKLEKELDERSRRFFKLEEDIRSLDGITLVANPLVWNDGYPLGDASPLSRSFEQRLRSSPNGNGHVAVKSPLIWLQAAGNTRGQTWSGQFHDADGNGFMEFAAPATPLKKGQWTTELNFLAWKPFDKSASAELPAGVRLHISLQWREPHDADYFLRSGDEDFYRKPLADLRLSLLRQRDPSNATLPADAFDLVAMTSGIPQRLEHQPAGSIYAVILETTLDKPGRYTVRVEQPLGYQWLLAEDPIRKRPMFVNLGGLKPSGVRPLGVVTLPALEKNWELQPRLFVDVVGAQRLAGRAVLSDFATDQGSVGLPADARSVITVGAADWQNQTRPYSAGGPLPFAELARKPSILSYDALQFGGKSTGGAFGTSVATSFAAGTVAAMLSAGITPDAALTYLKQQNGRVLKVPDR